MFRNVGTIIIILACQFNFLLFGLEMNQLNHLNSDSEDKADTIVFLNYAISGDCLKNWKLERQDNLNNGVSVFFYLKKSKIVPEKAYMRIDCIEKDTLSLTNPIKQIDSIWSQYYDLDAIPPLDTTTVKNGDNKIATITFYRGNDCDYYKVFAYFEEKNFWVILYLNVPAKSDLIKYYPDFKELINSYHIVSDSAFIYKRYLKSWIKSQPWSYEFLEEAYKKDSESDLKQFLDYYSSKGRLRNQEYDQKPFFEKSAYDIYKLFYTPNDLSRFGRGEFGDSIYKDVKYFIVQNEIEVQFSNKEHLIDTITGKRLYSIIDWIDYNIPSILSIFSIKSFYPDVESENCKIIYYSEDFKELIEKFLDKDFTIPSVYGLMSSSKTHFISEQRKEFLNKYIKIFGRAWEKGWHVETHPIVNFIVFNKNQTEAVIYFRLIYGGGEATFKYIDNKWVMLWSSLSWVE